MRRRRLLAIPLLGALMAGCSNVAVQPLVADANSALITGQFQQSSTGLSKITFVAVDETGDTRPTGRLTRPILVPPGPHVLKVQSCAGPGNTFGCRQHRYMQFVAQAGHEYIIDQGLFNRMSMRDATTGQLVVNSDDVLRELPAPQG